ncbi:MAG: aldo/keto reductase [Cyclobacteriaceae bacterium]|nr:aldo/keto reductase [Cyclobacteriaceae bacterium]
MQYRNFGRTDWKVSEIGFGGWQLGGTWGPMDEKESIDTLLYAFEKGVNFVDTAIAYGQGRSETVVGKALEKWNSGKIYVATKITPIMPELTHLDLDNKPQMKGRYPEWYMRQMVEGSLKRLGVERLDLLQLHLWLERGITELDWLETLNALRKEGKIDRIGVSLADIRPHQGLLLAKYGLVDSIQVLFNLFEQEPAEELFPEGQRSGVAFISRVPLDSGSLTGTWDRDTYGSWSKDDKRHLMYRGKRFAETLERVDKLRAVCKPFYTNLAEAAMRYVLHQPAVKVVIPGMRNRQEVDMNVVFSDGERFPESLLPQLKSYNWKHEFYH